MSFRFQGEAMRPFEVPRYNRTTISIALYMEVYNNSSLSELWNSDDNDYMTAVRVLSNVIVRI